LDLLELWGYKPLKGRPGLGMAVWSQVKVSGRRLSLRPRCNTKAPLQPRYVACGAT